MVTISPGVSTTTTQPATSTTTQVGTTAGGQSGSIDNTQTVAGTQAQSTTGTQGQANTYLPWQSDLQQTAGTAAGNYVTSGAPPPGVTGAPPQLVNAYMSTYNQQVAPQIAWGQGPGSPALGSNLALGLEQLEANVYGTNLNAYQRAIDQAGTLGFNAVGATGNQAQGSSGTTGQTSTSNTDSSQNWQQAMADLVNLMQSGTSATNTYSPPSTI